MFWVGACATEQILKGRFVPQRGVFSQAVKGKRDDKTRDDCLGACVCVWVQCYWQAGAPHAAPKPLPGTLNAKVPQYSY